ncbi:hypothetical protein IOO55_001449 [Salmonella enterica]|nr:hypothetical protein [Salmonella enterica]EHD3619147.1 hypothetical protein [Salmonella enterica]EHJ1604337.1 hypothetical protein [Salmonella enterica]
MFDTIQVNRFIPAGAGNTTGTALTVISQSVYPRWRGEHAVYSTCL